MKHDPTHAPSPGAWSLAFLKLEPLLIFLLPFAVYAGTTGYGFRGPDNYHSANVFDGSALASLKNVLLRPYFSDYIPVTMFTIWVDRQLFGPGITVGARVHEILWFALGCVAVLLLLRRLGTGRWTALVVALLYTLHPLCSESMLWVAQRKTLVALAFLLWATERHVAGRKWTAIALFILSLLAKIHAVALPAILTGFGGLGSRIFSLSSYYLLMIAWVAANLKWVRFDLQTMPGAPARLERILNDGPILWTYLRHTAWPTPLPIFPAVHICTFQEREGYLSWLAVLASFALLTLLARRKWLVSFLWLAGLAALGPTLNLAPQPVPMSAHYLQWALPFWLGCIGVVVADRLEWFRLLSPAATATLLAGAAILIWSTLLVDRMKDYATETRLWIRDVALEPGSWGSWMRLMGALSHSHTEDMAGAAALRALEAPDHIHMLAAQRCTLTLTATRYLIRFGRRKDAADLISQQVAHLPPEYVPWLRGQEAYYLGDYKECVKLLSRGYTATMQSAAVILRRHCRKGNTPPCAFTRVLALEMPAADEYLNNSLWGETETTLNLLTEAHLKLNEPERAFDTAAVLANLAPNQPSIQILMESVYMALGEAGLAARTKSCTAGH
jgi:hypothetical protein